MTGRRAPGETLALVLKALSENPGGLTTRALSAWTGLPQVLLGIQLGHFRRSGHVRSRGSRQRWVWYVEVLPVVPAATPGSWPLRSVVVPSAPAVSPSFALASSRVIRAEEGGVPSDDFSEGAFMRDWCARRSGGGTA